jgi:hypothetical protein
MFSFPFLIPIDFEYAYLAVPEAVPDDREIRNKITYPIKNFMTSLKRN